MNDAVNSFQKMWADKIQLLQAILVLSEKQPRHLMDDDTDALMKGLEERQRYADEIDMLDARIAAIQLSPEETKAMASERAEMVQILRKIQKQDLLNQDAARNKLDEYMGLTQKMGQVIKGISSYAPMQTYEEGIYFDEKK